jgi:tRNA(fMet)-specific endonuclease VapC
MICLDTNAVIAAINLRPRHVRDRLERALVDNVVVGIHTVALFEMWYGAKKSARPQANTAALATFLRLDVTPWPFEPEDAEEAGISAPRSSGRARPSEPTIFLSRHRRGDAARSW